MSRWHHKGTCHLLILLHATNSARKGIFSTGNKMNARIRRSREMMNYSDEKAYNSRFTMGCKVF